MGLITNLKTVFTHNIKAAQIYNMALNKKIQPIFISWIFLFATLLRLNKDPLINSLKKVGFSCNVICLL